MKLITEYREKRGKEAAKKLRKEGRLPGVVYGKTSPFSVSIDKKEMQKFMDTLWGRVRIFEIEFEKDTKKETRKVIIQDYQKSPVRSELLHIDFREVDDETPLRIHAPIKTIGKSQVEKLGGVMQIIRNVIPIKCKAKHIPEEISINVEKLNFGESIHVLDILYPEGVIPIVTGRNFTLITAASAQKVETETEEPEEEPEK